MFNCKAYLEEIKIPSVHCTVASAGAVPGRYVNYVGQEYQSVNYLKHVQEHTQQAHLPLRQLLNRHVIHPKTCFFIIIREREQD